MGKDWPRFLQCILQPLIPNPIDTDPSTLGGERESGVKGWLGAGVEITTGQWAKNHPFTTITLQPLQLL
jgi:hypothetical protein